MENSVAKNSIELECLEMISRDLKKIKINPKYKGFTYLAHAIFFSSINNTRQRTTKSILFTTIADMFDTRIENVERACRNAIESAYFNDGFKVINEILDFDFLAPYERPTLTCFISTFAQKYIILMQKLKLENKKRWRCTIKKSMSLKCNKLFSPALHIMLNN